MNVFVLTTGRSGSVTFARACGHITNYTTGHETRRMLLGRDRLAYPDRHIEVDNHLAWFPGRLEAAYGEAAFYVHLRRDDEAVAASYSRRWNKPLFRAYRKGLLLDLEDGVDRLAVARDMVLTMNANIELFLRGKRNAMRFQLEDARSHLPVLWERILAEGDLEAALGEFEVRHHAGGATQTLTSRRTAPPGRAARRASRRLTDRFLRLPRVLRPPRP